MFPVFTVSYPEKSLLIISKLMEELSKNHRGNRYIPLSTKLAAVRSYVLGESSYSETHTRNNVSSSTFARWLNQYKLEVLTRERLKRLSLSRDQSLLVMTDQEHQEVERLRQEVDDLRLANEALELMLELAKERLDIDVKKNYEAMLSIDLPRVKKDEKVDR